MKALGADGPRSSSRASNAVRHQHSEVSVRIRIRLLQAARDRSDLLPRLLERYTGLDAPPNLEIAEVALFEKRRRVQRLRVRLHRDGNDERRRENQMHAGETLRRDADDGEVETTEADLPPDDARIGTELLGPRAVREHDDRVSSRHTVLVGRMARPSAGCSSSTSKKLPLTASPELALRGLIAPGCEAREADGVRRQAGEALRAISQIGVVEMRDAVGGEEERSFARGAVALTLTTWSARGTGSGRRTRPSARLNMAALAPTPIAIDAIAISVKPGFFTSIRAPWRRS